MKKSKLLSGTLTFVTLFTLLAVTMACDNGTETARDFSITGHPKIVIHGLPSLAEPYINDFEAALYLIYHSDHSSNADVILFKNYINVIETLTIIVEDVPEYGGGKKFRITDNNNEFAMRSAFLSTKPNSANLANHILVAVVNMEVKFDLISMEKLFNNAEETIRMVGFGFQRSQCQV
jgi:hypothetical protein